MMVGGLLDIFDRHYKFLQHILSHCDELRDCYDRKIIYMERIDNPIPIIFPIFTFSPVEKPNSETIVTVAAIMSGEIFDIS